MYDVLYPLAVFAFGLGLMMYSAEKLVRGIVGVSVGFGLSAFMITAVFVGFDPENMAAGAAGASQGIHGIAIGSIVGAIMVPVALAFGLTAMITRMRFRRVSKQLLLAPVAAMILLYLLSMDGLVSRLDGVLLLAAFAATAYYLIGASRRGLDIRPAGELKESLAAVKGLSKWKALAIMVAAIVGIVMGSELLVEGAKPLIGILGITDTLFGMTILAFLISIEELAKQLPAALKGRYDISYGNMNGSVLHFVLLNAGVIALVNPISIAPSVLYFYFPVALLTVVFVSVVMATKQVPRYAGLLLVLLYFLFILRGFA
ncbi:MAG: sodium:calcium antiporter [Candidatus Aenigmatarchaeota archaeon]